MPGAAPGFFVVELDGATIGIVTAWPRATPAHPARIRPEGGEVELGYLFLPETWGHGYAAEACAAALDWCAGALPGEPVVLMHPDRQPSRCASRKLGFSELERFEEFGAEQPSWSGHGQRGLTRPSSRVPSAAKPKHARVSPSAGSVWSATPATSSRSSLTAASAWPSRASRQIASGTTGR